MPREEKFNVEDQLEGGVGPGLHIPPPPVLIIYKDTHAELDGYEVGDELEMTIRARIIARNEEGQYDIELSEINIPPILKEAQDNVETFGFLSNKSLRKVLEGE